MALTGAWQLLSGSWGSGLSPNGLRWNGGRQAEVTRGLVRGAGAVVGGFPFNGKSAVFVDAKHPVGE
jgi:hypothetical protein